MWLRRGAVTVFAHRGGIRVIVQRIDLDSYICAYFILLLYQAQLSYIFT